MWNIFTPGRREEKAENFRKQKKNVSTRPAGSSLFSFLSTMNAHASFAIQYAAAYVITSDPRLSKMPSFFRLDEEEHLQMSFDKWEKICKEAVQYLEEQNLQAIQQ